MTIATRKPFGWTTSFTGFGTEFPAITNSAGVPVAVSFNSAGTAVLHTHSSNIYAYPWTSAGFGTRYVSTVGIGGTMRSIAAPKNDNNFIAVTTTISSRLWLFPWNDTTGLGTAYNSSGSTPSPLPAAGVISVIFHPTQQVMFCAFQSSPGIRAYRYSSSGFGTSYVPSSSTFGSTVSVHPNGDAVVVAGGSTGAFVHPWTYAGGFGAAYAQPTPTAVPGSITGTAFSPDGQAIIFGTTTAPYIHAYAWNSSTGFGAKFADPPTGGLTEAAGRLYFSPDGRSLIATPTAINGTIGFYKWSASGFGSTMYTNTPNIVHTASLGQTVAFNPAGNVIVIADSQANALRAWPWQS